MAGDYFVAGADAPLVTVRLSTLKNGNSVLGVNWAHILGDAAAFSRFLEDVSLLYNLPAADLDDDMPTLEPHVRLPPYSEQIGKDFKFDLLNPLPLEEVGKGYGDAVTSSQMFTVTLTPEEVKHITSLKTPGEHLSDNDLIAGWWVSVLERAGQRVEYVVQTINVSTILPFTSSCFLRTCTLTSVPLFPQGPPGLPSQPLDSGRQRCSDAPDPPPRQLGFGYQHPQLEPPRSDRRSYRPRRHEPAPQRPRAHAAVALERRAPDRYGCPRG